jgi:hypothetical protein
MPNFDVQKHQREITGIMATGNRSAAYILLVAIIAGSAASALLAYSGKVQREIKEIYSQTIYVPIREGRVMLDSASATTSEILD